jgi:hypothetical protein
VTTINLGCSLCALLSIFTLVKKELKELRELRRGNTHKISPDTKDAANQILLSMKEKAKKFTLISSNENDADTVLSEDRDQSSSVQVSSVVL